MSQSSVHVLIHYMQPQAHMHTTHPRSPCSPCTSKTSPPACEPPLCIFSASEHFRCYLPSICQGSGLASSRDRRHVERPSLNSIKFTHCNSKFFATGEALAKIFTSSDEIFSPLHGWSLPHMVFHGARSLSGIPPGHPEGVAMDADGPCKSLKESVGQC